MPHVLPLGARHWAGRDRVELARHSARIPPGSVRPPGRVPGPCTWPYAGPGDRVPAGPVSAAARWHARRPARAVPAPLVAGSCRPNRSVRGRPPVRGPQPPWRPPFWRRRGSARAQPQGRRSPRRSHARAPRGAAPVCLRQPRRSSSGATGLPHKYYRPAGAALIPTCGFSPCRCRTRGGHAPRTRLAATPWPPGRDAATGRAAFPPRRAVPCR